MSADVVLFWGRIGFLVGLYVFILYVVFALRRDLRSRSASPEEAAPGELVIIDPAGTGLKANDAFPLMTETFLGRGPENNVQLLDATVSGRHGRLTFDKSNWCIEDLGSRNGISLDGRPVKGKTNVRYGQVISLGGVSLKLVR